MGIVVIGAVFVDIKGYPGSNFIPTGRNAGRGEQVHGGVGRNVAEDIANCVLHLSVWLIKVVSDMTLFESFRIIRSIRTISGRPGTVWGPGWRYLTMMGMSMHPSPNGRI